MADNDVDFDFYVDASPAGLDSRVEYHRGPVRVKQSLTDTEARAICAQGACRRPAGQEMPAGVARNAYHHNHTVSCMNRLTP